MGLSPNEKGEGTFIRRGGHNSTVHIILPMLHLARAHSITVSRSAYNWEERVTVNNNNNKNTHAQKQQKHTTNCFESIYGSNFTTYIFLFTN